MKKILLILLLLSCNISFSENLNWWDLKKIFIISSFNGDSGNYAGAISFGKNEENFCNNSGIYIREYNYEKNENENINEAKKKCAKIIYDLRTNNLSQILDIAKKQISVKFFTKFTKENINELVGKEGQMPLFNLTGIIVEKENLFNDDFFNKLINVYNYDGLLVTDILWEKEKMPNNEQLIMLIKNFDLIVIPDALFIENKLPQIMNLIKKDEALKEKIILKLNKLNMIINGNTTKKTIG